MTAADTLSNNSLGNYTLVQPTGLTGNITAKALTVTGTTVSNKIYDGTTTATLTGTLSGVVSIDAANVTLVPAGTFSQSNVGTGLAVTAADTLVGGAAGNYTLTQPTGLTANITPKALTVSGSVVNDKVYDGMTAATLSSGSLVGVVSGDNVSLNQAGTFSQSNVGTGLVVTAADTLSNNSLGNYTLVQPTGLTANITPKALTVSNAAASNKVYDGADRATLTGTLNGVISADIPNVSLVQSATFSQANVGTGLAVTAADVLLGSVAGNYTLTQPTGLTANITPKALTVTGTTVSNKVYDGTTTATLTGTLSGVVSICLLYTSDAADE